MCVCVYACCRVWVDEWNEEWTLWGCMCVLIFEMFHGCMDWICVSFLKAVGVDILKGRDVFGQALPAARAGTQIDLQCRGCGPMLLRMMLRYKVGICCLLCVKVEVLHWKVFSCV